MTQFSRTGGHGYTFFEWMGTPILYVQQTNHVSPTPVAPPSVIQPMNYIRPLEIAGPRAISHGVITFTVIQGWKDPIWKQLLLFANSSDLADIFDAQNSANTPIHMCELILNPGAAALGNDFGSGNVGLTAQLSAPPGTPGTDYTVNTYRGCKIADLRLGVSLDLTTIQVNQEFDVWYTDCVTTPLLATGGAAHSTTTAQDSSEGAVNQ